MSQIVTVVLIVAAASVVGTALRLLAARIAAGHPVTYLGTAAAQGNRRREVPSSLTEEKA